MTAARFWKVAGVVPRVPGIDLTLGDVALYAGATRVDGSATLTCTAVPIAGALGTAGVTFAAADATAPGFALQWDFGAAQSVTELRLTDNGISDMSVWTSDDALGWSMLAAFSGVPTGTVTIQLSSEGDPYIENVVLLLHGDGVDGSTVFTDSSMVPKTVTPIGGTQISTAQFIFGGSSMVFNGATSKLTIPSSTAFDLGTTYTIEFWVRLNSLATGIGLVHRGFYRTSGGSWEGLAFSIRAFPTLMRVYFYATNYSNEQIIDVPNALTVNIWTHIAMVRNGTNGEIFINGVSRGTVSGLNTPAASTQALRIGVWDYDVNAEWLDGYIDDLRITKGVARYTGGFAPPTAPFSDTIGGGSGYVPIPRPLGVDTPPSAPQIALFTPPDFVATTPRDAVSIDGEDGGWHRIAGTVKEKGTPENTPLARKVQLYHQTSGRLVRETWSAASDGSYSFTELRGGQPYFVVAFDHTGTYRAVIADNLFPEAMTP